MDHLIDNPQTNYIKYIIQFVLAIHIVLRGIILGIKSYSHASSTDLEEVNFVLYTLYALAFLVLSVRFGLNSGDAPPTELKAEYVKSVLIFLPYIFAYIWAYFTRIFVSTHDDLFFQIIIIGVVLSGITFSTCRQLSSKDETIREYLTSHNWISYVLSLSIPLFITIYYYVEYLAAECPDEVLFCAEILYILFPFILLGFAGIYFVTITITYMIFNVVRAKSIKHLC